ncbi:MAG: sensor histidine kinase [Lyngbya sp. HA4199-MV5]|jgi:signal transduction histidine kinase|nr:sensor histidine kinase [Lyngbya sp. HA4199-MV5]
MSVKQLVPTQRNFFRLLLYLEWILLGIAMLTETVPNPMNRFEPAPLIALPIIVVLGLMGLRVPRKDLLAKLLYTGLEFGLIAFLLPLAKGAVGLFPLLYLVIAIRSCTMFQPQGRLVVAGLAFVSFVLTIFFRVVIPRGHGGRPLPPEFDGNMIWTLKLNATLTFGLTLVFVLLLVNALLSERQSREQLTAANEQLRQYALRIENQATLQERNRIAREIHDSLGHLLTAQSIQLENALLFLPSEGEKTRSFLTEARQLGAGALHEVRQSVATLRSDPLQGKPLELAIAHLVKSFQQSTDITPAVITELRSPLSNDVSTAIYRILQEALTNIAKHAAATQVSLHLWEKPDGIHLRVEDNGHGFNPDQNTTGFGLKGMRERSVVLGGQFSISSQPQTGCQIAAVIPLSRHAL